MPSSSMTRVKVESADLQKVIPVATGASQARDFQTQDRSAVLEPHFSHQRLKPIPPNGRRARVSLILINDMNVLSCPSQAESTLHQVVLAHGTGRVVAHLHQCYVPGKIDSERREKVRTHDKQAQTVHIGV